MVKEKQEGGFLHTVEGETEDLLSSYTSINFIHICKTRSEVNSFRTIYLVTDYLPLFHVKKNFNVLVKFFKWKRKIIIILF
jgi:hypothetical protein